MRSKRREKAK